MPRVNAREAYKFILSSQKPVALLLPEPEVSEFESQLRAVALSEGAFFRTVDCSASSHSGKLYVTDSLLAEVLEEEVGAVSIYLLKPSAPPREVRNRAFLLLAEEGVRPLSQLKGVLSLTELLEEHERSGECEPAVDLLVRGCNPLKLALAVKLLARACSGRGRPVLILVRAREIASQLVTTRLPSEARLLVLWPPSSVPRPCELDVIAPRALLREAGLRRWSTSWIKVGSGYVASRC